MTWSHTIAQLLAVAFGLTGCLGTTPEEAAAEALGDDPVEEGPRHRAGQPCLVCHGSSYTPGDQEFVVAGTVYRRASDRLGLEDAEVEVTDASGAVFAVLSNPAGNFMVSVGELDEDRRGEGWLGLPRAPVFPLAVRVRYAGEEKRMRNLTYREGSCAACHDRRGPGARSAGAVYLEDTP